MKRYFLLILGIYLIFHHNSSFALDAAALEYRVSILEPHTHYFEVEITMKRPQGNYIDFKMPVWTPGSYLIREYAGNVEGFRAYTLEDNSFLEISKLNKNTWRVNLMSNADLAITYRVYAFAGSVRMSYLDEGHAFIMANTLLMYVDEFRSSPSILKLEYPDRWTSLSTSLRSVGGRKNSFIAANYDVLVDSPIEIGNHHVINFKSEGVEHEVAIFGNVQIDEARLVRDFGQIVESATAIFQDNPNERYTFIVHTDRRQGGLEHLNSTVIGVDRYTFMDERKYKDFLSLVAHEYLHLWMVKRLKPVELEEIDYENEVYTDLLWVMEGFTEYFECKIMLRSGLYSEQQFINTLLRKMAGLKNLSGSSVQSVADASFDAWIKFYRRNENSNNTQVSYYDKGMVLAALLDLQIIFGSNGKKSLDDVVKELYDDFYIKKDKGIRVFDLKKYCEELARVDLTDFFKDYVGGTRPLDNDKYFKFAGIELERSRKGLATNSLGLTYRVQSGRLFISSIQRGGAAYNSGLNSGDELIALGDHRIDNNNYQLILNNYTHGDRVKVIVGRRGLILEKEIVIMNDESVQYTYRQLDDRSKPQIKAYNSWLGK